jgi:hypothetical protein
MLAVVFVRPDEFGCPVLSAGVNRVAGGLTVVVAPKHRPRQGPFEKDTTMNNNTTHTRTIAGAAIATAFAAIAIGTAACGTPAAPQEIGTRHEQPATSEQHPPTSADSAERQGQRGSDPARDGYAGPPRPGPEKFHNYF